jgi:hypothetical protein
MKPELKTFLILNEISVHLKLARQVTSSALLESMSLDGYKTEIELNELLGQLDRTVENIESLARKQLGEV